MRENSTFIFQQRQSPWLWLISVTTKTEDRSWPASWPLSLISATPLRGNTHATSRQPEHAIDSRANNEDSDDGAGWLC